LAHFYLDNDIALDLVDLLTAAGHTATSARAEGLSSAFDYVQMLAAWERNAVLITHNRRDFTEQHEAWYELPRRWGVAGPSHPGIIVPDHCPETTYGPHLIAFVAAGHPLTDRLYSWREHGAIWQRWGIGERWQPYP
jgi:hypothetical protein